MYIMLRQNKIKNTKKYKSFFKVSGITLLLPNGEQSVLTLDFFITFAIKPFPCNFTYFYFSAKIRSNIKISMMTENMKTKKK